MGPYGGVKWPVDFGQPELCNVIDFKSMRYDRVRELVVYMNGMYKPTTEGVSFLDALHSLKRAVNWNEAESKPKNSDAWKRLTPKIVPKSQMIVRYVKMVDGKLEVAYLMSA